MRFIPRKVHAYLDYLSGALLLFSPWIIGFEENKAATTVAYLMGLAIIILAFNTDYEGGATKVIKMPLHLYIDMLAGLFLAASPWLLGFHQHTFVFHAAMGALEVLAGLCTVSRSQHPRNKYYGAN